MLFWWLTACLSSGTMTSILSRVILCLAVTKPSDNSTELSTFNYDDVTIPLTSEPGATDDLTTSFEKPPSLISGTYDYESSINFDRYLQELGVSYILRQLAPLASPVVTIEPASTCTKEPEDIYSCKYWSIKTDTLFLSHVIRFKLDEPGKDTTMDGRDIGFVVTQTDVNRWVEEQTSRSASSQYKTTLVRDFQPDKMVVTLTVNDVISTSFFRRRLSGSSFVDDEI